MTFVRLILSSKPKLLNIFPELLSEQQVVPRSSFANKCFFLQFLMFNGLPFPSGLSSCHLRPVSEGQFWVPPKSAGSVINIHCPHSLVNNEAIITKGKRMPHCLGKNLKREVAKGHWNNYRIYQSLLQAFKQMMSVYVD